MKSNMLILGCLFFLLGATGIANGQDHSLRVGSLDADLPTGASFLEDEAGISAYGQVSSVDLDLAENAYKNVEEKTEDYIIGSVTLDNYDESNDVHVYVDITGWIVAYYLNTEKSSKIIDWKGYVNSEPVSGTKLSDAITLVTLEMLVLPPTISYYDFRYPSATNMMIVIDEKIGAGTETFRIMVPNTYSVYGRTWSHAIHGNSGTDGSVSIDGTTLHSGGIGGNWGIWEGDISPSQLFPDLFHEIALWAERNDAYVAVMLIYTELE